MSQKRDEVVSLKTNSEIKKMLKAAADSQRRTVSNMLEVMVIDWCERNNLSGSAAPQSIPIPRQDKPAQ